jgi:hypothetical protein
MARHYKRRTRQSPYDNFRPSVRVKLFDEVTVFEEQKAIRHNSIPWSTGPHQGRVYHTGVLNSTPSYARDFAVVSFPHPSSC